MLAEAGGVGQLQEDAVELLVNGVRRVMAHLGMSDSEGGGRAKSGRSAAETAATTVTPGTPTILTKFEWVYTKNAGMFYPRVAAGDLVQKGQEIGTIGSLFGDVLETIIAPVTGRVLFLTINPSVSENGLLMGIGVE